MSRQVVFVLSLLLPGLLSAQLYSQHDRKTVPAPNDRTVVSEQGNIRVTTAVASAEETEEIFGKPLYRRNIQPVWVQIENLGDEPLYLLPRGMDEAYFTPIETAYRLQNRLPLLDQDPAVNRDVYARGMGLVIDAGDTRSGYIFSRVDQGTKSFNVDVIGRSAHFMLPFFIPVPGLQIDHYEVEWESLYAASEIREVSLAELRRELAAMPCCVTGKKGETNGDPLNIAVVGSVQDAYYSFMRAGWDETETIYAGSLWNTAKSALSGSEYRYSPVSALYVFGRAQDVALQKARTSIHERNHLRLWMTPLRYEGKPVWIGQISRDIGVRFTPKTWNLTTHKIDPDVDEARDYVLDDLMSAGRVSRFGYAAGVEAATASAPRHNLTGDPYFTDGLRAVLVLSDKKARASFFSWA
jgi:hypothetical protein